jgi:2-C-methyl-D-erythritol 4-phosphate cytidylyltransferase
MPNYNLYFLIVAAGKGLRMGSKQKKQYLLINNIPVLSHTLSKFLQYKKAADIVLVVPEEDIEYCKKNILKPLSIIKKVRLVSGGKTRQISVSSGLEIIKTMSNNYDKDIVIIHDGVRPFIDHDLIDACLKGAIEFGACVPAIKATDTLKVVHNEIIAKTLDRENIYLIQTPQAFLLKTIVKAMEYAVDQNFSGTDDASLVEFFGDKVTIIEGLKTNIKITTKEDLEFAKAYLTF